MYIRHGRMCVCLSVCLSLATFPHYCTDPDITWGNHGTGCPLIVHYWADLRLVHGIRCYDNRSPNAKCQRVFVLALCLVLCYFVYDFCAHSRQILKTPLTVTSAERVMLHQTSDTSNSHQMRHCCFCTRSNVWTEVRKQIGRRKLLSCLWSPYVT